MAELVGSQSLPSLPPILLGHITPEVKERVERFYFSVAAIFETWVKRRQSRLNPRKQNRRGGFRADVDEAAGAGLLGSAKHTPGVLDVDPIPGVRRSPLLDEGGAVNHDLSASDIGGDDRIKIAPDRLGTDGTDLHTAILPYLEIAAPPHD